MISLWNRRPSKGLYSPHTRERRRLEGKSKGLAWLERDIYQDTREAAWSMYNSSPEDQFRTSDQGEGFGDFISFEAVKSWVASEQARGKRIASLDVCGQTRLGREAGVNRAIGWSLFDARPQKFKGGDSRERIIEGSIFDLKSRTAVFGELDALKEKEEIELGLAIFRPWSGMHSYRRSRYGHMYFYEFLLRPVYQRMLEGGMILISSHFLVGMQLLRDILDRTEGVEYISNRTWQGYLIRKRSSVSQLRSLSEMGDLSAISREFTMAKFESYLPQILRWAADMMSKEHARRPKMLRE